MLNKDLLKYKLEKSDKDISLKSYWRIFKKRGKIIFAYSIIILSLLSFLFFLESCSLSEIDQLQDIIGDQTIEEINKDLLFPNENEYSSFTSSTNFYEIINNNIENKWYLKQEGGNSQVKYIVFKNVIEEISKCYVKIYNDEVGVLGVCKMQDSYIKFEKGEYANYIIKVKDKELVLYNDSIGYVYQLEQ